MSTVEEKLLFFNRSQIHRKLESKKRGEGQFGFLLTSGVATQSPSCPAVVRGGAATMRLPPGTLKPQMVQTPAHSPLIQAPCAVGQVVAAKANDVQYHAVIRIRHGERKETGQFLKSSFKHSNHVICCEHVSAASVVLS
jgi:hypothetical protein